MASKSSPVAKHHFWILFGIAPLFLFVAFLLMVIMVGMAIASAQDAFKKQADALNTNPKSVGEVKAKDAELVVAEGDRQILWSKSYQEQLDAGLFNWPVAPEPKSNRAQEEFNRLARKNYKFGDKIQYFGRVMDKEVLEPTFTKGGYEKVAADLAPTRFADGGSYAKVLRVVTDWGTRPLDTAVFWLALEDFWVQRGLLEPIAKLNAAAALFTDVTPKDAKDADLKRMFQSRTWELDLEVGQNAKKKTVLQGQLRNRTARLQLLGANKAMKVLVWYKEFPAGATVTDPPDVVYEIRGESVPGKGALACTPQEIDEPPPGAKIGRVVQVFDEATVPVRLVNTVALGMLDHKNQTAPLEMPKHLATEEVAADAAPPAGSDPLGTGSSVIRPPGSGGDLPGANSGSGTSTAGGRTGSFQAVLLGNKNRYVKVTSDVRRMPVAVSVVVDNDYVNDLMVAYTNSPLHFQITQTQWARYKGTLPKVAEPDAAPPTTPGSGDEPPTSPGGGKKGASAPIIPGSDEPSTRSGGSGYPGSGGYRQPMGPNGGTMSGGTGSLPPEAAANLCEFALFGVVSLYEQVPADQKPKDDANKQPDPMGQPMEPVKPADQPKDPTDKPKDAADKPKDPMDKSKDPTDKPKDPADKPGDKPKEPAQTPPPN